MCRRWLRLSQTKRRPQSSKVLPYCPMPEIASARSLTRSKRESMLLRFIGLASFCPARIAWPPRRPGGIVAHLDHPELAVLIERHCHRALDLRLGRNQLNAQAGSDAEERLRLGRGEGTGRRGGFLVGLGRTGEPEEAAQNGKK